MSRPLVACDLDRTLIYSAAALGLTGPDHEAPPLVVAEVHEGRPISYLTRRAAGLIEDLAGAAPLVPVTTRTLGQYRRIRLSDRPPRYAVAANGGHLLVDGRPDPGWHRRVAGRVRRECATLDTVSGHLARAADPAWLLRAHVADDLFWYAVIDRPRLPAGHLAELAAWCADRGWTVSVQGRKLYCVPGPITKWAAVAEIRRRLDCGPVFAAGDSRLDEELLSRADTGIRPAHGELHDSGWRPDRITVTTASGVLAGEEIAGLLLDHVRQAAGLLGHTR
ncbi:hypothetical protein Aph02nite_46700 [Actinoplanes philippinensis]|uniref:Hydroxymethylpyrimidine pyrophosphatase n=1 Tax=Actinoplanes philippinensis TaxID=35752 RepID=A0A1I2I1K6_9ACTN|nr:HAD family hydrolase [Actinoplanes philippinensis]GIE78720.1 hypothetical protein Aph02nite_46700 [Actinoplanes philippinensis]SFF36255.1 hypothetical protein SAMN05421541_109214 [Actinoplanes philippinensis]